MAFGGVDADAAAVAVAAVPAVAAVVVLAVAFVSKAIFAQSHFPISLSEPRLYAAG